MEKDKKYIKKLENLKIEYKDAHKYAFFAAIIIGMLAHFTLYSHEITTTDGFTYGTRYTAGEWEISLGRWLIVILNKFRYGLISPAHITFFSIFILAISAVLIIDVFEIKKKISAIFISASIVVAPFVYQTLLYEFTADAYFIAWGLSILAVFMYKRKNTIFAIISIILSLAIYQSYINVVMFLGLALIITKLMENKYKIIDAIKELFLYYIMCFVGILFYYIITIIVLKITGIEFNSHGGASANGFTEILRNIPFGILRSYSSTLNYYTNNKMVNNFVYDRQIYFMIMFGIMFVNICLLKDIKKTVFIIYMMLLSPIVLAFSEIIIIERNINILMSASLICPIFLFIKIIDINECKILKYVEIVIVAIILYTYLIMGEATYISLKQNYEQVYSKLIRVVDKVESHEEFKKGMKVAFLGEFEYFNELDVYELDNGDSIFLGVFGPVQNDVLSGILKEKFAVDFQVHNVRAEEFDKYIKYKEAFYEMESFPNDECIRVIEDIMLVKLSEKDK